MGLDRLWVPMCIESHTDSHSPHLTTTTTPTSRNTPSGALSVPLGLAVATGLWVWVLPETRGIELPKLLHNILPLPATVAASPRQESQEEQQEKQPQERE